MKKKCSLKIFLYAVLGGTILASGCAISAFSFAWFSNNNNVTRGFDGSTTGAYFARGNGSEGNPYVINKPIHLYNLAWLQYVGFFKDKEKESNPLNEGFNPVEKRGTDGVNSFSQAFKLMEEIG